LSTNASSSFEQKIIDRLEKYNINFIDKTERNQTQIQINFSEDGKNSIANLTVRIRKNELVNEKIVLKKNENQSWKIAQLIFQIGSKLKPKDESNG
jgi:hypothetical protein